LHLPIEYRRQAEQIEALEREIEALSSTLNCCENELHAFEHQIRLALSSQINYIIILTARYKQLKAEKKAKRLEQKKRGKNYSEPVGIKKLSSEIDEEEDDFFTDKQELKRLFKEAVVHVHPDKFANADEQEAAKANELTAHLNHLYKKGELMKMRDFHRHIVSGNAIVQEHNMIPDPLALIDYLEKQRDALLAKLNELKANALYKVLMNKEDVGQFIEDLRVDFNRRVQQLEKRTRKFKE